MDNYKQYLLEYVVRDRQLRSNRAESDYEKFCEEHCVAIEQMLKNNDLLDRQIKIKDEYANLIWAIGHDYDGCESPKELKRLIDGLIDYSKKAKSCDDTTPIYGAVNRKYNILMEDL